MRSITSFVCQECGYDSPQWLGKCPECGNWNSLREIQTSNIKNKISKIGNGEKIEPKRLDQIKFEKKQRILTGFTELDGVLGGGIVRGSAILLAGDPGIGKSTLLLQIALQMSQNGLIAESKISKRKTSPSDSFGTSKSLDTSRTVLYISGEESEEQIKLRADRINPSTKLRTSPLRSKIHANFLLVSSTNTDLIFEIIAQTDPSLVIIDSIQTMESENVSGLCGSVGQVRYAAFQFIKLAKTLGIPIIMVGHVTKEGMVAGPMVLSHMVDTVLFLEGEKFTRTRILRSLKNRFGPVDEVGLFAIEDEGIKELNSPEQFFLSKTNDSTVSGSVLSVTMEGTRAFLIEIQALVLTSKIPIPRRVASGVDYKRLELLLAVLQKHCNIPLSGMDVFVNVAGGIKLSDPATDLSICLAIISSSQNIKLSNKVGIGEVGLLGELRKVNSLEKRIKEARKLGFKDIISLDKFKTLREVVNSLNK